MNFCFAQYLQDDARLLFSHFPTLPPSRLTPIPRPPTHPLPPPLPVCELPRSQGGTTAPGTPKATVPQAASAVQ